ncbi:Tfp pilus assembly protein PilF [Lishizhenia tianjinensis]|uniref:Tfp pilus assembly protein PilF n=1 Tax=Lishizhenia tianjinensis TaxID=477690 RepID=A0A1I6ZX40_9FLAO|nr:tetratricopeptide repeat protein [Lishizhenia tianjinensis]SFT67177.1 Tfp pilus assembly protein PilF [Lishizhenia tianjinensis]
MKKVCLIFSLALAVVACKNETKVEEEVFVYTEDTTEVSLEDNLKSLVSELEKNPNNVEKLIDIANFYKDAMIYQEVLPNAAKAFRLDSTNLEARKLYAWSLINQYEPKVEDILLAREQFEYILSKEPRNPETYVNIATTYTLMGDYKSSFNYLDEAIKIDQQYRDAYILKGTNYRAVGNEELAISSYETALQIDQEYAEGFLNVADYYVEIGNPIALEYYQTAYDLNPSLKNLKVRALYGIAKTQQDLGQFKEALASYRKLAVLAPSFEPAYFNPAYIKQFKQKEIDSAVYYYNLCVDVNPKYIDAWHNLGLAYAEQGRKSDAARAFSTALSINPDYTMSKEAAEKLLK